MSVKELILIHEYGLKRINKRDLFRNLYYHLTKDLQERINNLLLISLLYSNIENINHIQSIINKNFSHD